MSQKIFISYSHQDGKWVLGHLKPILEAAGAKVLVDVERFRVGRDLGTQMDETQDQADLQLLVLSAPYYQSEYCQGEMQRALAQDPGFRKGKVILVRRDDTDLPVEIQNCQPLYVKLSHTFGHGDETAWASLLKGCHLTMGNRATQWLNACDEICLFAGRKDNICLHADKGTAWRQLLNHLRTAKLPQEILPDLKLVDLENPQTASRPGLIHQILSALGYQQAIPGKPADLVTFGDVLTLMAYSRIALTHFDRVATPERSSEYGSDLFAALRHFTTEPIVRNDPPKRLGLLLVCRVPFATLLPQDNPLSNLDVKTVRLERIP